MAAAATDVLDVLVIGGGVTGLAAAAEIAASGRSVAILERHPRPGMGPAHTTAALSMPASTTPPAH